MKKIIGLISTKRFLFGAMILMMLGMFFCIIHLGNRLEESEKNNENLTRLLGICQEQLFNSEEQVISHTTTISELQNAIYVKDIELDEVISSSNATLFDEYFSSVNFNDGLSYTELRELNKQYSLSLNDVNLKSIGKQLELNKTLIDLTTDVLEAETDDTMKIVLQALIDSLQEEYDRLLPFYEHFLKESKELEDYDNAIPMPVPIG
ncbi:MAG: hypothetical protein OSJ66_06200 [Clostridia bacterium]|nr:hypothetical protein [Clostridia bacterium]